VTRDLSPEKRQAAGLCRTGERGVEFRKGKKPTPRAFCKFASKGFSFGVSLLFATFARSRVNVADKGFKARVRSLQDFPIRTGQIRAGGKRSFNWNV